MNGSHVAETRPVSVEYLIVPFALRLPANTRTRICPHPRSHRRRAIADSCLPGKAEAEVFESFRLAVVKALDQLGRKS
jgi:hypothetical protein